MGWHKHLQNATLACSIVTARLLTCFKHERPLIHWSFYSKNESKLDVQSKLIWKSTFLLYTSFIVMMYWQITKITTQSVLNESWLANTVLTKLAWIHRRIVILDESYPSLESCMCHLMKLQQQVTQPPKFIEGYIWGRLKPICNLKPVIYGCMSWKILKAIAKCWYIKQTHDICK